MDNKIMPARLELRAVPLKEEPLNDLPVVSRHVADALTAFLKEREQMQRPPEATAKVLAFIILAYHNKPKPLPFPTRPQLAEHLGISIPSVDVVLSQRQGTKDIRIVSRLKKGNIKQRVSTIKYRIVIPTNPEHIKVVLDAAAEDAAAGISKPAPSKTSRRKKEKA